jgi:hypothetical protein
VQWYIDALQSPDSAKFSPYNMESSGLNASQAFHDNVKDGGAIVTGTMSMVMVGVEALIAAGDVDFSGFGTSTKTPLEREKMARQWRNEAPNNLGLGDADSFQKAKPRVAMLSSRILLGKIPTEGMAGNVRYRYFALSGPQHFIGGVQDITARCHRIVARNLVPQTGQHPHMSCAGTELHIWTKAV